MAPITLNSFWQILLSDVQNFFHELSGQFTISRRIRTNSNYSFSIYFTNAVKKMPFYEFFCCCVRSHRIYIKDYFGTILEREYDTINSNSITLTPSTNESVIVSSVDLIKSMLYLSTVIAADGIKLFTKSCRLGKCIISERNKLCEKEIIDI